MRRPDSLVRTNIFFSVTQRESFKKLASAKGIPAAELIRIALDKYLHEPHKQSKHSAVHPK